MAKGQGFSNAISPYIQNIASMYSQYLLNEGERKKQEEARQQENTILNQIFNKGKDTYRDPVKRSVTDSKLPFSSKYSVLGDLVPKAKEPEKQDYYQFDGNLYGYKLDPVTKTKVVDFTKPIKQKEEKPEKVWIKDERYGDKMNKLMGYENPDADEKDTRTRIVNGKKYTITDHSTFDIYEKKEGTGRIGLTDTIKKSLADYYKEQQRLLAITNAGLGEQYDTDRKQFKNKLTDHNTTYVEAVQNNMPESATNWYRGIYDATDENKQKGNPDPEDYWRILREDYIAGKLGKNPNKEDDFEDVDFQILTENFKAIYGFDPVQIYGH